jgi:hypothetical protein
MALTESGEQLLALGTQLEVLATGRSEERLREDRIGWVKNQVDVLIIRLSDSSALLEDVIEIFTQTVTPNPLDPENKIRIKMLAEAIGVDLNFAGYVVATGYKGQEGSPSHSFQITVSELLQLLKESK